MTTISEAQPRILLITSLFAPEIGGVCKVAESIARELPKHVVVVAARTPRLPKGFPTWESFDKRFDFVVHRIGTFNLELPKWITPRVRGPLQFGLNMLCIRPLVLATIWRIVEKHSIGVLCVNTLSDYWIPRALQRFNRNLKAIFYIHGEEVSIGMSPRRLQKLQFRALRDADALVAVSSFTRGLLNKVNPKQDVVVINNGVNAAKFIPGPKDLELVRRFRLEGKLVLLCLCRLDVRKGQDMLIMSMSDILKRVPNAVLLIVGSGDDLPRLLELRQSLQMEQSVIFAGAATDEEVVAYYRTADLYVMPNRQLESGDTEGFGLVFLEAGACGKPVIGGQAGGVPDAIIDGETGYLVDGTSPKQISGACIKLLLDAELRARFGALGREYALTRTWAHQAGQVLALCHSLSEERI